MYSDNAIRKTHFTEKHLHYLGFIEQGQTIIHRFQVDPDVTSMRVAVYWPGSDLELELIQPDGQRIDPEYAGSDPNIEYYEYDTSEYYDVEDPMEGEWEAEIYGDDIPEGTSEEYRLEVIASSEILSNFHGLKAEYNMGDTIDIRVQLAVSQSQLEPILNASLDCNVTDPCSGATQMPLYDDGSHNDDLSGDGIYGNSYSNTNLNGPAYSINVARLVLVCWLSWNGSQS